MALALHTIKPAVGSKKNKKRIGRGLGSGHGTYSTRGAKGQRARSGGSKGLKMKGLRQNLLNIPKLRGFKSRKPKMNVVNLDVLEKKFNAGEKINPRLLLAKGVVKSIAVGVKILGDGEITKKIFIEGCRLSAKAKEKIVKAGGKVVELDKKN